MMNGAKEKIKLVSLDTSTKISGCALFEDGKLVETDLINLEKEKDSDKRMNEMMKRLIFRLMSWKPDIIWVEHPQGGGNNVMIVNKLSEILGCVRTYAALKNVDYHEINPSEWRKYANIEQGKKKRDELKQASMQYVKHNLGVECPTDDLADAIAIGCAVINMFG